MDNKEKELYKKGLKKGVLISAAVAFVCLVVFFIFSSGIIGTVGILKSSTKAKIKYLVSALEDNYYGELDYDGMIEGLYKGLVDGVGDKYTKYYSKEEADKFKENISGEICGLGAILSQDKNTGVVSVLKVYDGSAAKEAGINEGDIIISADGFEATNADLSEFVTHTKGVEGTTFELKYMHASEEKTAKITRKKIIIPTVRHKMLKGNVGYIEIDEFAKNTYQETMDAINDLKANGAKGIIFDLRVNGGGVVESAVSILDEILPEGKIVSIVYNDGEKQEYKSDNEKKLDMPIVVLTSEYTASASEIFSGAIRDFKAGTLIGNTTYGKGVVQRSFEIKDGSMINITAGKYYTPKGECIHEKGIKPDIEMDFEYLGTDANNYIEECDNQILKGIEVILEQNNK